MSFIILVRHPLTGKLHAVKDDDGEIQEHPTQNDASLVAQYSSMCQAWDYDILEVDAI